MDEKKKIDGVNAEKDVKDQKRIEEARDRRLVSRVHCRIGQ